MVFQRGSRVFNSLEFSKGKLTLICLVYLLVFFSPVYGIFFPVLSWSQVELGQFLQHFLAKKKKKKVKICCLKLPGSFKQEYFDHKKNAETILFYKALFTSLLHLISLVKAHVKTKFLSVLVMLLNKNYKEKHFLSNSLCFKYPV